jgi:putative SOS response-associated peptidase YedK
VFPDYPAPVVRNVGAEREMTMMRWGMPPPPRAGGPPVTNIRNTSSPHWRGWLKPENRCLVPANSFAKRALKNKRRSHASAFAGRLQLSPRGSFAMARRSLISMHRAQINSPSPAGGARTISSSGANSSSQ